MIGRALGWLLPRDHSGPAVARLFHRLLALVFLDAWLSLAVQVHLLIGSRGLMPIHEYLARARHQLSWADFPTLFWLGVGDGTLSVGVAVGIALSLVALFGRWPRACAAVQVVLYLSFTTAARTFLSFQWDNLLLDAEPSPSSCRATARRRGFTSSSASSCSSSTGNRASPSGSRTCTTGRTAAP